MDILFIVLGFAASGYTAYKFFQAGKFKATTPRQGLLEAGFGWVEKTPFAAVRLIAWLEIIGAIGLVLAPVGYLLGYSWAIWFAIAAGVGLALTMVGAMWVHGARGEAKYTFKMNLSLLGFAALSAGLWAAVALI